MRYCLIHPDQKNDGWLYQNMQLVTIILSILLLLGSESQAIILNSDQLRAAYNDCHNEQGDSYNETSSLNQTTNDSNQVSAQQEEAENDSIKSEVKFEPMPILSYDTDTGIGFGAKAFLLNYFNIRESFDLIIFFSTKGEKWVRTVISLPDFELRQGTEYPIAIDFIVDYDKWVAYNFFGIGNQSSFSDKEIYTRKLIELNTLLNRGFSKLFVGTFGLKYKHLESSDFDPDGQLINLSPDINRDLLQISSLYFNFRYDSRDSYIHPEYGIVLQADYEYSPQWNLSNISFHKWSLWIQYYRLAFFKETVFAFRIGISGISGNQVPLQLLMPLGGNRTLRGYPQDRFLDQISTIVNLELRFPIYRRLGGMLGTDIGQVWPSLKQSGLRDWHSNLTIGLRYYFDTYIVRVDIGISTETFGIYFNFGHIF